MNDLIKWLLEDDNPSVKLYTFKEILNEKIDAEKERLLIKNIEFKCMQLAIFTTRIFDYRLVLL